MEYFLHIGILICIYIVLGISFNLLMGAAHLFSIAHAAMFGVGAYFSALCSKWMGFNVWCSMLVAAGATATMGAMIGFPALRVKSYYLAVLSLGFQQVAHGLMVNLVGVTGGKVVCLGYPALKFSV